MFIFIRKLSKCPACKGSKIIKRMGGIETRCNQCGKFITYFNRYCMQPVRRYIVKPVMMHLVPLTVLAFFIMTCLAFCDPAPAKIAEIVFENVLRLKKS